MNQTTATTATTDIAARIREGAAIPAERITAATLTSAVRSLQAAYLRAGVETPVSGDQLTILANPRRSESYRAHRIERTYGSSRSAIRS